MENESHEPKVIVVSGPNGAGKSTVAKRLVVDGYGVRTYVNADDVAKGLAAFQADAVAIDAARIVLNWLKELAARRQDFAFETTLAGKAYARWIRELVESGYRFHLHYITLPSASLAVERVAGRVALGGHGVPSDDVRRRYQRGLRNFFTLYMPLADDWALYENASTDGIKVIAFGERHAAPTVVRSNDWQGYWERGHATE